MNKFMRLFALLLVVVAIVLVVLAFQFGGHETEPSTASNNPPPTHKVPPAKHKKVMYTVVTAASTLKPGTAITADQLKVQKQPQKVSDSYESVAAVVGKVPAVPIASGSVLKKRLMLDDLSLKLLPGQRAVAIPVSETNGAGNHIHAGDFVDVFFNLKHRGKHGNQIITQSRLLLPRMRVLAYGSRNLPQPAHATSSKKKHDSSSSQFRAGTAVLAVPVDKVNRLLLATHNGKLSLALRNPKDPGMPNVNLFPQPAPVLIAKTDGESKATATADLPGRPAADPDKADNHAYAGIRLDGLANGDPKPRPRARIRRRSPPHHRVDVIRGTQHSHITVYNHQGATP